MLSQRNQALVRRQGRDAPRKHGTLHEPDRLSYMSVRESAAK
jgi:hypothetical protein